MIMKDLNDGWFAQPGDLPASLPPTPPLSGPCCWAGHPLTGYVCSRREGHGGRHMATTSDVVIAVWNSPERATP